jgi:predicted PhzF superfamily epimerase YddE/YHI9
MTRFGPVEPNVLDERLRQLGLDAGEIVASAWIDNGPGWMGLLLESAEAVLGVELPGEPIRGFDVGLIGLHPAGAECAVEVRGLFSDASGRVREDPVTGSLNASTAQWLLGLGTLTAPYVAAQGTNLGRHGRVHVEVADGEVWVGGDTTVTVTGTIGV